MSSGGIRVYNRELLNDVCNAGLPSPHDPQSLGTAQEHQGLGGVDTPFSSEAVLSEGGGSLASLGSLQKQGGALATGSNGVREAGTGAGISVMHPSSSRTSGTPGQATSTLLQKQSTSMVKPPEKSSKLQTIAANEERYRQMHEKARREAERRIQENAKRRDLQFNEMFANVQNGIDRKSGILKEVDQIVEQSDRSKDKRARALYQSWNEQVYLNIQKQLQDQLNSLTTEEIEDRLNRKYDQFLQASNQKSGVFMNANNVSVSTNNNNNVNPSSSAVGTGAGGEGKAHTSRFTGIKVSTGNLNDPLKRSLLKIKEESHISVNVKGSPYDSIGSSAGGQGVVQGKEQLGRECLATHLWGEEMLQTTPYGHLLIKTDWHDPNLESSIHMNHFKYPKGNKVAFENFPKGKKEKPDLTVKDKATFSLIQMKDKDRTHAELIKSGDTHGDLFLLSRGKRMEEKREKGIFDLVGHTCYKNPEVTGGDMWLEARGKQRRDHTLTTDKRNGTNPTVSLV